MKLSWDPIGLQFRGLAFSGFREKVGDIVTSERSFWETGVWIN